MKIFKKILYNLLFLSFALMILSSFFSGTRFFEWTFGLSFVTTTVCSLILSAVELGTGELPNPYSDENRYID